MKVIPVKIKRILKEAYLDLRDFGWSIMSARAYCTFKNESVSGIQKKNQAILDYLEKQYAYLIEKYKKSFDYSTRDEQAPIWVFWWSGEENMPEVIRACLKSKIIASGQRHPVVVLSKYNIDDYVEFPKYIWDHFSEGKLKVQHLADMIRVQLIKRYGGIWLDASVYCIKEIPDDIFEMSIYSMRGDIDRRYISNNQWTTFVIGGWKNNILCSFLNEFFLEYCKVEKRFIDYYMFDCAIALAYRNIPVVRQGLDKLIITDGDYYWLNEHLSDKETQDLIEDLLSQECVFQKISWRRFENECIEKDTLYSYLINREQHGKKKG